jgi:hypothetical protein
MAVGSQPEVVFYERSLQEDRKVEPLATEPGFGTAYVDLMLMQTDEQGGLPLLTPLGFSALRLDTVQREVRVFRQGEPLKVLRHVKLGNDADAAIRQNLSQWRQEFEATFKGTRVGCASGSYCAELARSLLDKVMQAQGADGPAPKQLQLQ